MHRLRCLSLDRASFRIQAIAPAKPWRRPSILIQPQTR
jgi:hypothetical protein